MRARTGRTATLALLVASLFALSFFFEPRKTTYSCKTVASCLGLSNRHRYAHAFPAGQRSTQETALSDGSIRFERTTSGAEPEILFLVLTKDATSWSQDFRSQQRNVYDFLDLLTSTKLNLGRASLALLTSSKSEYVKLTRAVETFPLAKITVIYQPESTETSFSYRQRHDPKVQLQRRAAIAALRNYLMIGSLADETHILWIDADVVEFSPGIVQTMLKHSDSNAEPGIMTARCYQHLMDNYDKNAWRVNSPQLLGSIQSSDREPAVQKLVAERLFIPELLRGTRDEELVPLDSVGGTILYIRASLVRKGVIFPTFNIVGTEWSQFGWIGVETEGICYVAKSLPGGGCFVLGGSHFVRHSDWG